MDFVQEWKPRTDEKSFQDDELRAADALPSLSLQNKQLPEIGQESLGYSYRLHQRREFLRFFDKSEVFRLRSCVVFRVANTEGHFRLGLTMKAKGTNSVERNRVRRGVRETVRRMRVELGSYDYNVVIPKGRKLTPQYVKNLTKCLGHEFREKLRNS